MSKTIKIANEAGFETDALVFFDPGSQLNFVTKKFALEAGLKQIGEKVVNLSMVDSVKEEKCSVYKMKLSLEAHGEGTYPIEALAVDKLIDKIKTSNVKKYPKNSISQVKAGNWREPNLLVGVKDLEELIPIGKKDPETGFRVLESKIGPIAFGAGTFDKFKSFEAAPPKKWNHYDWDILQARKVIKICAVSEKVQEDVDLKNMVKRFHDLETIGVLEDPSNNDDLVAERIFQENIRKENGKYVVRFLWKELKPALKSNQRQAYCRLISTYKSLKQTPGLLEAYHKALILDPLRRGVIEEVKPDQPPQGVLFYLPHHLIQTPDKVTTKLRPVFDASAKESKGDLSLNDCIYRGPNLMADLAGLLVKLRTYRYVLLGDIEKAFHQIILDERDRDATRFYWLHDLSAPPTRANIATYRSRALLFGVICCPFELSGTVNHHLDHYVENRELAKEIKSGCYADNVILEANSEEEILTKYRETKLIFKTAGMNMREYISNCSEANEKIPKEDLAKESTENLKILGTRWNLKTDRLALQTPKEPKPKPKSKKGKRIYAKNTNLFSKRVVLTFISSIFDVLGFLAPAILPLKIFLQELWNDQRKWDEPLSLDEENRWDELVSSLLNQVVAVPRYVVHQNLPKCYEIHLFSDASGKAYSVAAYLRQFDENKASIHLIFAKSRLKPPKKLSIPRMELLGVLIATRVSKFLKNHMPIVAEARTILWTDSKCVLSWILASNIKVPVFEANRLREIKSAAISEYRYVPTDKNPSDLGTRGCTLPELVKNNLWWHGPKFLEQPEVEWPEKQDSQFDYREWLPSPDENFVVAVAQTKIEAAEPVFPVERYGNWEK